MLCSRETGPFGRSSKGIWKMYRKELLESILRSEAELEVQEASETLLNGCCGEGGTPEVPLRAVFPTSGIVKWVLGCL